MQKDSIDERLRLAFGADRPGIAGVHASALIEVRHELPGQRFTHPLAHEDAYLVLLHLQGLRGCEAWIDGQSTGEFSVRANAVSVIHLVRDFALHVREPLHLLLLYLPTALLRSAAEGHRFEALQCASGRPFEDDVVRYLGHSLLPALRSYTPSRQPFVDYVLMSLGSHLVHSYSGTGNLPAAPSRGLAPWQERRAKELMRARLKEGVPLTELAKACRLSASAFARAFKQSTGVTPYQWFLSRRIELSMELMTDHERALAEIALLAGFADQSHFTRVFTEKIGVSPGQWRSGRARTSA